MASNLTVGVVSKMLNGQVASAKDLIPVLQVTELKLISSKLNQNQESNNRYKLLISDGTHLIQGMLNTCLNVLVRQGNIQLGSLVKLTDYVCNLIQGRRLVVIINLEVVLEKCDIIGTHVQSVKPRDPVQSSIAQRGGAASVNTQSSGAIEQQQGRKSDFNGAVSAVLLQPQVGQRFNNTSSGYPETSPSTRPYMSSNASHGGSRLEQQRAPATTMSSNAGFGVSRLEQQRATVTTMSSNAGFDASRLEQPRAPVTNTYPRLVQSTYQPQPQQPMYVNRGGPVARNEAPPKIIPIAALNPYQGRWTIKVRVTSKGELRRFSNVRGEGKLFSFDLLDADGGEIRVTCFNDVVDRFFDVIVVGNVYLISRGNLKPAQKNYNHLPNDYEIQLDAASTIQQCFEDDTTIPRVQFSFRNISDIENMESNSIVDLIGIVSSISPTGSIMRKNGTEVQKRALQLKDMSGRSVEVTMWGNFCNTEGQNLQSLCDSGVFPVLAVKTGRISEFNGKQVSTIGSSQLFIEPDFPEARELREWYDREGSNAHFTSISREFSGVGRQDVRKVISQIKDEKLGTSEKPDWITVSATISFMKVDNFCYSACPIMNGDRPCSKKVTNNGDGTWRCEKCDRSSDECDYRYILQIQLQDHTGLTWATAFQEAGEEIMGMSAKDLYYVKYEHQDEEKFENIIRRAAFNKYIFKLKVKEETYSDESRVKATVLKAEKINYSSDTRFMLEAVDKLRTGDAYSLPINPESSSYRSDAYHSNTGTSGFRETASVDARGDFGLPATNQVSQHGNQYINHSRSLGGSIRCDGCGSSSHVAANCPTLMSEPQLQYMSATRG